MIPPTTKSHVRTTLVMLLCGVLLAGALLLVFKKAHAPEPAVGNDAVPVQAQLSGTYLCLPHRDTSGPQTEECMAGLRTDDGAYYAIDFGLMSQTVIPLSSGDSISAQGVITPVEMLSSNHWQKYPIIGIFSVTSSLEKVSK